MSESGARDGKATADRSGRVRRMFDAHGPALVLYARQWSAEPEDIVQAAFVKLAAQRTWPRHARAWLFRVVRNEAISALRAAGARRKHEQANGAAQRPWFVHDNGEAHDAAMATAELGRLPLSEREVIIARLWGGLTFRSIAKLTGCSASEAHRRYISGLKTIRDRIN